MSTPFPLEQQAQLDTPAGTWNPWQGHAPLHWYSGMGFNEDTMYLGPLFYGLEGAGQGAAMGEQLLSGIWHHAAYATGVPALERSADELAQDARARVKRLTPNPATTGAAAQMIHGLASGAYRYTAGTLAGGPLAGASLVGATQAVNRVEELHDQGVPIDVALGSGAVSGATSFVGALLPGGVGKSLAAKVLSGVAGNVAFGMASRYADSQLLEDSGYHEMAQQERPWDSTALLTDAILGGAFGALAHLHGRAPEQTPEQTRAQLAELERRLGRNVPGAEDAALTANLAMRDRGAAPGAPTDPASAGAHQTALEQALQDVLLDRPVDVTGSGIENSSFITRPPAPRPEITAAFVDALREGGVLQEQTKLEQLERSLNARLSGDEPPSPIFTADDIPRSTAPLTPEQRAIEARFSDAVAADYNGMKARYAAEPAAEGGKVLNTDTARELSPDYKADRSQSAAVHEPASFLMKQMYAEALASAPKDGEKPLVLFTAGGTGAGKSSAVKEKLAHVKKAAQIVYDTNMNGFKSAKAKIDDALTAGKNVVVAYVHREPVEALEKGALTRAMRMERESGTGRTVPLEEHVKTHVGANETVRLVAEHYANDPRVQVHVLDNTRGKQAVEILPLEKLPRLDYNTVREKASAALEEAKAADRISERVYRGFRGPESAAAAESGTEPAQSGGAERAVPEQLSAVQPAAGTGPGEQPHPQRGGGRSNELVATATGRTIEVRPRLVEAADLLTSDKEGYPAELQPRQRGDRVALQEQVREIAQKLEPTRLGAAPEADRGAPITGPGNVVESGNGRVMALREVYANHPERAQAYRQFLESLGYDLKGMKEPVLVRERVTELSPSERQAFTVEANQAATASLSPVERAQADAKVLDGAALSQLRGGDLSTARNAPFVRSFLERIPQSERNAMVNPDGTVSQEGVRRLQAAILAKAYGGTSESNTVLGRMLESTDTDMRSTLGAMLDAAPAFAKLRQAIADGRVGREYDIARALTQAIETTARVRESGQALGEFLKQDDFLTRRAPIVDALIRAMYDRAGERLAGRERVAQTLMNYADRASKQRLDQGMLFAEAPLSPDQLVGGLEQKEQPPEMKPAADMFGLRRGPETAPDQVARQVLETNPNIEIAGSDGEAQRGRAELIGAAENLDASEQRAEPALSIAASCFGQRAA